MFNIKVHVLPTAYPQGGELQLIRSVTGKEIKMDYMNKSLLNSVGLSYGELSLKGKNRGQFEKIRLAVRHERLPFGDQ